MYIWIEDIVASRCKFRRCDSANPHKPEWAGMSRQPSMISSCQTLQDGIAHVTDASAAAEDAVTDAERDLLAQLEVQLFVLVVGCFGTFKKGDVLFHDIAIHMYRNALIFYYCLLFFIYVGRLLICRFKLTLKVYQLMFGPHSNKLSPSAFSMKPRSTQSKPALLEAMTPEIADAETLPA